MQFSTPDWILEQKNDTNGKTGEVQIKSRIQLTVKSQCWFLSTNKEPSQCKMLTMGGNQGKDTGTCTVFIIFFCKPKITQKQNTNF